MLYWPFHSLGRYSKWLRQCGTVPIRRRNSKHVLFDTSSSPRLAVAIICFQCALPNPDLSDICALFFPRRLSSRQRLSRSLYQLLPFIAIVMQRSFSSCCTRESRVSVRINWTYPPAKSTGINSPAKSCITSLQCGTICHLPLTEHHPSGAIVAFLRIWRRLQMLRLTQLLTYLLYILKVRQQVIFKDEELEVI